MSNNTNKMLGLIGMLDAVRWAPEPSVLLEKKERRKAEFPSHKRDARASKNAARKASKRKNRKGK